MKPVAQIMRSRLLRPVLAAALAGIALVATSHLHATTVNTLSGGPWQGNPLHYGNQDGNTASVAQFHTPYGLALDSTTTNLYLADRDNNAVRRLDLAGSLTSTFLPTPSGLYSNLIRQPVGVAVRGGSVFVLNRGNGTNGTVLQFGISTNTLSTYRKLIATNAANLINAAGMAMDTLGNIYVTVQSNTLIRIAPPYTNQTVVATVAHAGASLQGLAVKYSGAIAVCDSARHGIYSIDASTGVVTTNAGFKGAGDFINLDENLDFIDDAKFNGPYGVAIAGDDTLIVADTSNHRVKLVLPSGGVANLYGVRSNLWYGPLNPANGIFPGWSPNGGIVSVPDDLGGVEARQPVGVLFAPDGNVYVTEQYYHLIRKVTGTGLVLPPPPAPNAPLNLVATTPVPPYGQVVLTWSASAGATNYILRRSTQDGGPYNTTLINTTSLTYTDTNVVPGTTYYYVVAAANAGGTSPNSAQVSATPPMPPVPDPQIGYVDFPASATPIYSSVFHPVSSFEFFNDAKIIIKGTPGSSTHYEYGYTAVASAVPNPTTNSGSVDSDYQDGITNGSPAINNYVVPQVAPFLTIKAVGTKNDGSPNSAVVTALFQFKTGNPVIIGNNAAQFSISDITEGARLYYTLDGSDPSSTNINAVDLGTVATPTNVWTVSFPILTNTLFKVRAFRDNFQPSAIVSSLFSPSNFVANTISFGFATGEASSEFKASPGQTFFAPVTLSLLPGVKMYSLQFNMTATNVIGSPAVPLGDIGFESMLVKPVPDSGLYTTILPQMFVYYETNFVVTPTTIITNLIPHFTNLVFSSGNLLGVGWLERFSQTNLYDTRSQDLITYSMAHDTLFSSAAGKVIAGGFSLSIPTNATTGSSYQIQIGRPSATSDGIGASGSDVYIATPTNGSSGAGAINSIKIVTIEQRRYTVGDVYPFRWFNVGDFGDSYLRNADVMQVFQSVPSFSPGTNYGYGLNRPPPGSDFYGGMDSCCGIGADTGGGYLTQASQTNTLTLYDGNDASIDSIAFGDDTLDVADVYVTFRRSLDPSRIWFQRFWTNGVLGAATTPNIFSSSLTATPAAKPAAKDKPAGSPNSFGNLQPRVIFTAGDAITGPGQTVAIPITANILGNYPLRVLMLNLTVVPLDGSPAITAPVQFTANPALGTPYTTSQQGNNNYGAVWLNSAIAGLTGNASIGTLQITLPAGAPTNAAYAINFEHVSGSPNGIAVFPKTVFTGLVTLANRSGSSWNDGISDAWRLRHFGTIYNQLSAATADADGDRDNNLKEYQTGTNPNDATSVLRMLANPGAFSVRWPSILGKTYIVERSTALFNDNWTGISTNAGSGGDLQISDSANVGGTRFYRVRVAP